MRQRFIVLLLVIVCIGTNAYSMDHIKLSPDFESDCYIYALLEKALEVTKRTDGPFTISQAPLGMKRNRALHELIEGSNINIHIAATRREWESKTLPIRIPIIKGLLGYRLFLINKKDARLFKKIKNIEKLKKLRAGSGQQWTTTAVLLDAGFTVVTGSDYEGLFGMLEANRFDYFPRGINEIYFELEAQKQKHPDLDIDSALALYFPTPSYFFISPQHPHLADRIQRGLEILIQTGEFDTMFNKEFATSISRAKLNSRKLFIIENPFLTDKTPFDRPELWFSPDVSSQ
nr:hypothetical protein [uncultured Pseudodesulfovibrio sp.]